MKDPTNESLTPLQFYSLGEHSITIVFGNEINLEISGSIHLFNENLLSSPFPGFITTVVAYGTLTVHYNIEQVAHSTLRGLSCFDKVCGYLKSLENFSRSKETLTKTTIRVPVCYGFEHGPDLADLAKEKELDEQAFIDLHCSCIYTVYMIGFVPGFAYLGGMNPLLSASRKLKPRSAVPAGSVGIAGLQTGIYPLITPGGWQLIGQTPLRLFDPIRSQPSLFHAGDLIQFYPISVKEFNHLSKS